MKDIISVCIYNKPVLSIIFLAVLMLIVLSGCGGGSILGQSVNSVTLSWDAPTTNTDGTPLSDLSGYIIYYGTFSGDYTSSEDIGLSGCVAPAPSVPHTCTYTVTGLTPGVTYYFAATAYDVFYNESDYSNEVERYL